jgi:hypothetical protein
MTRSLQPTKLYVPQIAHDEAPGVRRVAQPVSRLEADAQDHDDGYIPFGDNGLS